jgi:hypothetical protein
MTCEDTPKQNWHVKNEAFEREDDGTRKEILQNRPFDTMKDKIITILHNSPVPSVSFHSELDFVLYSHRTTNQSAAS